MAIKLYAHVVAGTVREVVSVPDGLRPGLDLFTVEFAEGLVACGGDVATGWLYDGATFTAPPIQAPPPVDLVAYAAARRFEVETAGIVVEGIRVATDLASQARVTSAYTYLQASGQGSVKFKAASGWIDLVSDQLKAIALAMGAHVQACFAAEDQADAGISSGTITTPAQIDAIFAAL